MTLVPDALGFDPDIISPREAYSLIAGSVTPRPIALVSTLSPDGRPNLAPFSFFNAGGSHPPSLVFSVTPSRSGSAKDTLRNIQETGEYVVHICSHHVREAMNLTSTTLPYGESEWDISPFTPVACVKVRPPRAQECPIAMECRLFQVVPHGHGPGSANYVIGEVVYFHVSPDILTEGTIDPQKLDVIGRLGGDGYVRVSGSAVFDLARPA